MYQVSPGAFARTVDCDALPYCTHLFKKFSTMLTSSKHPWPALVHVFTLFMCLALQSCGTSAIGYGAIEKQPTSATSAPESGRKVLLTFL
ncbi:MAG: hypothetical protein AAFQ08_00455, partial [Bacteroidota bacterium]